LKGREERAVKFAALALDYDGTSAVDGVFDGGVREAVAEARRQGVAVILVTGRRIEDLRRVAGDLGCFDVVVGENGAVLEFPASGRHVVLSHPPSRVFLDELSRRHIPFVVGEAVVETDGASAAATLDALRRLELPLILAFNRGRLMILPQAVAKSTGLRHALTALRLSIHNTVGIGDAENDHDLLDACEVGVAVEWGSQALRAVADEVISGTGPPAVAGYIRRLLGQPRLSAAQMGRRRLMLGQEHDGRPVSLAVRGRTILIAGEPGTGKSWLAGLLCEQLILQGYCMCIVDPEGDYRSLEILPGVVTLGGEDPPPQARELLRALRHPDTSVIIDLSKTPHETKIEYLRTLLPVLRATRRRTGLPHKILLDEAHHYLCDADDDQLIDPELEGYIFVTYRVSGLSASIRATRDAVVLVTRETDPQEADILLGLCRSTPGCSAVGAAAFGELTMNEAALLPGPAESLGRIRRFQLAPRLTMHVRHREKYLDMPVADTRAFVFTDQGRLTARAVTLTEFLALLAARPPAQVEGHLRRHDFSRWFNDVFRDSPLATRLREIEARVGTESARDIALDLSQAIRSRYDMADAALRVNTSR
jgi:hydroxymethylpyrimidine pyrophosphatase-like HAD family hydrolase